MDKRIIEIKNNEMLTAVCFNGYFRIFLRKIRCWMECFVIFVMAWCWCNATESKPQNVVYNIFSELTLNDSLLFFPKEIYWNCYRKILCENWKPNRTLSINFVLKIRFRKIRCEIKTWNQTLRENLLCVTIRTFRWVLFLSSENIILYTTAV